MSPSFLKGWRVGAHVVAHMAGLPYRVGTWGAEWWVVAGDPPTYLHLVYRAPSRWRARLGAPPQ